MRTGLFKRLQAMGLNSEESLILSGMAYPYSRREWQKMPSQMTRGAERDGIKKYMTGDGAEAWSNQAQSVAERYLGYRMTAADVQNWLNERRPAATVKPTPETKPSDQALPQRGEERPDSDPNREAAASRAADQTPPGPTQQLESHTVTRLTFYGGHMDAQSLANEFAASGPPMEPDDLDLAASTVIDDLAQRLSGDDPRFRREVGSVAITGYMAGRVVLGTASSRLAYSTTQNERKHADQIKAHATEAVGKDAMALAGDATAPFLLAAAKHASTLGAAGQVEMSFPLLGIAATQGFAAAIAEHDLFAPVPSKPSDAAPANPSQAPSVAPTDSVSYPDQNGDILRSTSYYNDASEATIDVLEASETGYMLMFTLSNHSHDSARAFCERHVLDTTEFEASDLVAIETIKQGTYVECTAVVRVEAGDPRGKPDHRTFGE